jgi:succinyl-CoA synthetase beta subunit
VETPEKVHKIANEMIGKTLVTKQSGAGGLPCGSVYIVEKLGIEKEMYLSLTLDRKAGCPTFIYSPAGGMAIEDVAHTNPEKIFKMQVDPKNGLDKKHLVQAAKDLGLEKYAD